MTGWEDLAQRYAQEQARYERLARHVAGAIKEAVGREGIPCEVSHRAKEIDSFVKKAIRPRTPAYQDPLAEIGDKAGVRVVVTFESDVELVVAAIANQFEHGDIDDKRKDLAFNQLGYFAVHVEVWLARTEAVGTLTEFRDKRCEVQVQTLAGHLWSEGSHDLLYKTNQAVPPDLQRRIYRLVALVELFDSEMSSARDAIKADPQFADAALLSELERLFYQLTAARYDQEFSLANLKMLRKAYRSQGNGQIIDLVKAFFTANQRDLEDLYLQQARAKIRNPFMMQPESLAIFERLLGAREKLEEVWKQEYALEYLVPLASPWKIVIDAE